MVERVGVVVKLFVPAMRFAIVFPFIPIQMSNFAPKESVALVGVCVGLAVAAGVGSINGDDVDVGALVGIKVGVGALVGANVGVGALVGAFVGVGVLVGTFDGVGALVVMTNDVVEGALV